MIFAGVKKLYIPEGEVKKIECGGVVLWKGGYTNQVPLSINADGSIYNDGLGYKNGYRVRSGGAEIAVAEGTITGFIAVSGGDVIRISGCAFSWDFGTVTAINAADSSFTNLGQIVGNSNGYGIFGGAYKDSHGKATVVEEIEGIWKWIVPPAESGVAYIRITASNGAIGSGKTPPGAEMIVTINEEIE